MDPTSSPLALALIVAAARNGVIGRGGAMPWRMPSDLRAFRRLTLGKPVIMGRKTFQSIGKPLAGRDNIVVTRDADFRAAGVDVAHSLDDALALARASAGRRGVDEIMIIGGAEIFAMARANADRIYLTRIDAEPDGDTFFADPDARLWHLVRREPVPQGPSDDHAAELLIYEKIRIA